MKRRKFLTQAGLAAGPPLALCSGTGADAPTRRTGSGLRLRWTRVADSRLFSAVKCADHAYPGLLGHPLYTQEPVRYLAALGDKPWRPCAWHFQHMWDAQMKLARQLGAGVGVSNGWLEYTGLARLPAEVKTRMLADIAALFQ